ncbi:MAG: NAD(P)-binding domain-containing protein [Rhodospirillaceae bacterium]
MYRNDAIIIGAGQAGLAMSHCLSARGIDHVLLERGRVAERWRSERWDSLRLLTPNWMSRLPGWSYHGPDPDGFMTMPEVARFLADYAKASAAPVIGGTTVKAVAQESGGYRVDTNRGTFRARCVVIATGNCDTPVVPAFARHLAPDIHQVTPSAYRRPDDLSTGGVLVVGAAASGVQLAEEIHASGRPVSLSVGSHMRLPRRYRGRDIMWWLDRAGILRQPVETLPDVTRAKAQPSLQLVGRPDHSALDLGVLRDKGVRLVGRTIAAEGPVIHLRPDLADTSAKAQAKLDRLLAQLDRAAPPDTPQAAPLPPITTDPGPERLDLRAEGIRSIVWAVGFRRNYDWLRVPVLDRAGEVVHDGGVTPARGLYVLGLRLLRHRSSNFIDGVGADAQALAAHLHATLLGERSWSMETALMS